MQALLAFIQRYDSICVFRHQSPDPDALGSQWGLIEWIKTSYPEKKVYAMGHHRGFSQHLFGTYEDVSDETVRASAAIILDTANRERIDDQRYALCLDSFKVDHHPHQDHYANEEWVEDTSASTCELITVFIQSVSGQILSQRNARYLYMGMLTDTLRFSIANTSARSLEAAAFLLKSGINVAEINFDLFSLEQNEFNFINYIRSHATVEDSGLCYMIVGIDVLKEIGISSSGAKEKVSELGLLKVTQVWALFIEDEFEPGIYNGSLRSRFKKVNDIAGRYGGGGHVLAAAVKHLTRGEIDSCLEELRERIVNKSDNLQT